MRANLKILHAPTDEKPDWGARLPYVLNRVHVAQAETFCSLTMLVVGVWVFAPWWDAYATGSVWRKLSEWLPELVFGAVYIVVGATKLYAVLRHSLILRRVCCIVGGALWSFTALTFWWSRPPSAFIPMFIMMFGLNVWSFLRIGYIHRIGYKRVVKDE